MGREVARVVLKPDLVVMVLESDLAVEIGLLGETKPILATFTPWVVVIGLGLVVANLLLLGDKLWIELYLLFLAEIGYLSTNEFFFLISV